MDPDLAQRVAELEKTVTSLTDEKAIRELVLQYGFTADLGLFDEFVSLFTVDGVMDLDFSEFVPVKPSPDEMYYEGHEQLLRFITAKAHQGMLDRYCQHHTSGQLSVNVDGDVADAFGYSFVIVKGETAHEFASDVFRRWRFRRVDGVWRIAGVKMRPAGTPRASIRELRSES